MKMRIPDNVMLFSEVFRKNGHCLYLVGGSVRDYLLSLPVHDYDYASDATPDEIKSMFGKTIDTGIKHGTVSVLFRGSVYEVTTFRTDGTYTDSRHPENVSFVKSLNEDIKRRDFTVNAIAAELPSGKIIDYVGGIADLKKKILRAIGNPEERFTEDALRMMRAARFASELDFDIEEGTIKAASLLSQRIKNVSAERIREELFKLIDGRNPSKGFEIMRMTGLIDEILPELRETVGFKQGGIHHEDLYTHLVLSVENSAKHNYPLIVKIASLFHDIGKVETRAEGGDREYTFYGHEKVSARKAENILTRLKCSGRTIEDTVSLIENHMFNYTDEWSDAAVRRFIRRVGRDKIQNLFRLRIADSESILPYSIPDTYAIDRLSERIEKELDEENAIELRDLKINGNILMELGIPKGPEIGKILNMLLEEVIDDPEKNDEKRLKEAALLIHKTE